MKLRIDKELLKIISVLIGIVFVCMLAFKLLARWEARYSIEAIADAGHNNQDHMEQEADAVFYEGQWYGNRQNLETILIMGIDKYTNEVTHGSYNNNQQADFLLLLVLNHESRSFSALQINRDTMATIPMLGVREEPAGTFIGQLALAHTYGDGGKRSCENTVQAVSDFLYHVKIDHYISLTMEAVKEINDMAGGVSLTLLDDFTDYNPAMAKGAERKLTGEEALLYVRERKKLDNSTNLNRMKRQQQYLMALKDSISANTAHDNLFLENAIMSVSEHMVSDYTFNQLTNLSIKVSEYQDDGLMGLEGEIRKGNEYMEFYADEEKLQKIIMELFYKPYEGEE